MTPAQKKLLRPLAEHFAAGDYPGLSHKGETGRRKKALARGPVWRAWAAALGGFIVVAIMWPVKSKAYLGDGATRHTELALCGDAEAKLYNVPWGTRKGIAVSCSTPKELVPFVIKEGVDMRGANIDSSTWDFRTRSKYEWLRDLPLIGNTELKVCLVRNPTYTNQGSHGDSRCSARVFPWHPQSQCEDYSVLRCQKLMLRHHWEYVRLLDDSRVARLAPADAAQNNSEFSDISSGNCGEDGGNGLKMISNPNKGNGDKVVTGAIVVIGFIVAAIIYLRRENS